ncbi:MAG TPA: FHA domain-containing protein, partial [Planctomycetes bacterium]|nr:FHA domain-containing protein [Planctomycetota bacterium]
MSSSNEPIRLSKSDLYTPAVESYLQMQQALRREVGELPPQPLVIRVIYSSWFYLAIASGLGALVAWLFLEPFFDDTAEPVGGFDVVGLLLFPTVAGCVGLFLGAAEGLICRNLTRAALCGAVGLGIGFGGGLVMLFPAAIIFGIMAMVAAELMDEMPAPRQPIMPTGFALLVLMMGRAAAWAVAAIPAGLGQGIALREKKVIVNGLVGGVLGGLLGGLLFDPISFWFTSPDGQAAASRAIGFVTIGVLVGLFVGLVEGWTKTAWLLMRAGPLAGKQFVLYRDTTVLGSSPKAEVYLFKDDRIEPRHAVIYNRGGRFEIEDCNTPDGTYVNGIPIKRQVLHSGDQI